MGRIFRLDIVDVDQRNPYKPHPTRRVLGNVPYIVDNLLEWRRPPEMSSHRHFVCASPLPELAVQAGGITNGHILRVEANNAKMAQIPQFDAREHPETKSFAHLMLDLLGQGWLDSAAEAG